MWLGAEPLGGTPTKNPQSELTIRNLVGYGVTAIGALRVGSSNVTPTNMMMTTLLAERFPEAPLESLEDFVATEADHMVARMGLGSLREVKRRHKGHALSIMAFLFTLSFSVEAGGQYAFGINDDNQELFVRTFLPSLPVGPF